MNLLYGGNLLCITLVQVIVVFLLSMLFYLYTVNYCFIFFDECR